MTKKEILIETLSGLIIVGVVGLVCLAILLGG